jgi:hypothetical protein
MELDTIIKLIVLGAIAIELYALYSHSKLDRRIDEHILETERNLDKYDVTIQVPNRNMKKLDEHLIKLDEHLIRYDKHMSQLDEHMTRLDNHLWNSYIQRSKNIDDSQESKA